MSLKSAPVGGEKYPFKKILVMYQLNASLVVAQMHAAPYLRWEEKVSKNISELQRHCMQLF